MINIIRTEEGLKSGDIVFLDINTNSIEFKCGYLSDMVVIMISFSRRNVNCILYVTNELFYLMIIIIFYNKIRKTK